VIKFFLHESALNPVPIGQEGGARCGGADLVVHVDSIQFPKHAKRSVLGNGFLKNGMALGQGQSCMIALQSALAKLADPFDALPCPFQSNQTFFASPHTPYSYPLFNPNPLTTLKRSRQ
jgi:hypothetical protein